MLGRLLHGARGFLVVSAAVIVAAGCTLRQSPSGAVPAAERATPMVNRKSVPFFERSFTLNGTTYIAKIVGTDPALGLSTTVGDQIIPVDLIFPDGTSLDGTTMVGSLLASPVFTDQRYPSGKTQFSDGLMRAEFWTYAKGTGYHVLLAPPTVEPTVVLKVPIGDGSIVAGQGRVAYQWFVRTIEPQLLQQLNVDPTTLSMFVTYHTTVLEKNGFCCYGGYHSSFDLMSPSGPADYTTAWASVGPKSVVAMAHEVTEWMNDPFYTNVVPSWLMPLRRTCGGDKLEVGDPEASVNYHIGGYQVSDMTFFSWFAQDNPSLGINGQYDMLGHLSTSASPC